MSKQFKVTDQIRVVPEMAQSRNEMTMLLRYFRSDQKHIVSEVLEQGLRVVGAPLVLVPFECAWPWEDDNGTD